MNNLSVNFDFNTNKKAPYAVKFLVGLFYVLLLSVLITQIIFSITHYQAKVYGESMQNTLNSKGGNKNDIVFVNKFKKANVGDIIVASDPFGTQIIKRVIAVENDRIRYEYIENEGRCVLYINGEKKDETYIKSNITENVNLLEKILPGGFNCILENVQLNDNGTLEEGDDYFEYIVPKNHIFVMGDNREKSQDSREYGAIKKDSVLGVVEYVLYYGESKIEFWFERMFGINIK